MGCICWRASKAGQHTHGLGRFYSSLAGRPIPGLSFLAASLIDVEARRSYLLQVEQQLPSSKASPTDPSPVPKRPRGRPKGHKNHVKATPILNAELTPELESNPGGVPVAPIPFAPSPGAPGSGLGD
jgi:hypothetical protein